MAYVKTETFSSLLIDGISEAFGAFVFSFFFLMVTQTNYMAG